MEKLYTTAEVAEILKVTQRTVYNYLKAKKLKAAKVGRDWLITESNLKKFIECGTGSNYLKEL